MNEIFSSELELINRDALHVDKADLKEISAKDVYYINTL